MKAQTSFQGWLEYVPKISLPKSFSLEFRAAYRTNFEDPRWHTYEIRLQPEYKLNSYVTFMVAVDFIRTHQNDHLTTFEIREALVAALHITPRKRIQTGITVRGEQRNVQDLETKVWTSSTRLRLLGSVKSPLNKKSMSAEHVLYTYAELEFFITPDAEIQERYANKFRVYAAMGYKVKHNLKLELMYMWQESKNTIHGDLSTGQNIFRFRVLQSFGTKKKN
ncbi:MAG: hypothetical protein C0591_06795 [Marinilabiliales bacterium]|nr:MAG: hypothetical protein C0591_06795 [Marinilabiliales bacterium]